MKVPDTQEGHGALAPR